jgi:hypothetical protein
MTIHHIYDTASEVTSVASNLWSVKNCFGEDTFQQLASTHLNHNDSWHRHPDCLEYRLQLTPDSPTLQQLQGMAPTIMSELEKITGVTLMPAECKMWLDLSGWHCPYHSDAGLLVVTYQVYLWTHGDVHGTEFTHSDPRTRFDFVPNTGYINLNTDCKEHHADTITGTRLSACWQFRAKV